MRYFLIPLLLLCSCAASTPPPTPTNGWVELFNGKNLKGWKQLNGKASYEVVDGMIVGTAVPDEPNSFLATTSDYGDFILELQLKVEGNVNSGVQIRSESYDAYRNGRVHGYQVEVDPSDRAWSGGIYDEARRGWLYNLDRNPLGKTAYRHGEWNTYRVEAIGSSLKTWVNGVPCANLIDEMTPEGFIALQVHGVGKDESKVGSQIFWKNIRIKTQNLDASRMPYGDEIMQVSYLNNELTEREVAEGWQLLWDGSSTDGWRGAKLDAFPAGGWSMADGILTVEASGGAESANGGDIVTTDTYSSFELELDFRITEGANSGIKYFVDPKANMGPGSAIGLEYQILDDKVHPDAKEGVLGNRTLASLYDLIAAPKSKRFNGVGGWNRARILVDGAHVEHWLNNQKVLEYERGTQMYRALIAYSKYQKWENFGEHESGHILLQDHGDEVSFRNIKIRELN